MQNAQDASSDAERENEGKHAVGWPASPSAASYAVLPPRPLTSELQFVRREEGTGRVPATMVKGVGRRAESAAGGPCHGRQRWCSVSPGADRRGAGAWRSRACWGRLGGRLRGRRRSSHARRR